MTVPGAPAMGHWDGAGAAAALEVAARHLGWPLAPETLDLPAGEGVTASAVRAAARGAGLRARVCRTTLGGLRRLRRGRVAVLRLTNGAATVLVRAERFEGGTRIVLEDPFAARDTPLVLDEERFLAAWAGEALLLWRPPATADDDTVPFGFALIRALLFADRRTMAAVAGSALALGLLALVPILFLRLLTVRVMPSRSSDTLIALSVLLLALLAAETALGWCRRSLVDRLVVRVDATLATRVFARLLSLPMEHYETVPTGLTVYRAGLVGKVRAVLLTQILALVLDVGVLLFFLPAMALISLPLTLMVLGLFALVLAWIDLAMPGFRRRSAAAERAESVRGSFLFQTVAGIRTVKTLAIGAPQRRQWMDLTDAASALRTRAAGRGNLLQSVVTLLERVLIVGSMAGGAWLALRNNDPVSVTTLFAFVLLSQRAVQPFHQVAQVIQQFDEARTAVEDIGALVNQPAEEGAGGGGLRTPLRGAVAFERVRFRYRGAATPALREVSFAVPAGTTLGIMGRSGSGKTTVTRLLQRLHADYAGTVRLDGVDVRAFALDHLRASLGVVLQENFLFAGTIFSNIAAAKPDATLAEVVRAARLAGAEEFIDRLPAGYDTAIGEGSPNLSGGQRQRLAIARALITDPRVLILDEATSALDADSEAIVNAGLARMAAGRTTLVISHRLSSLVRCDAILVMDAGQVHDIGTHAELLERCGLYATLWARQNAHQAAQAGQAADEAAPTEPKLLRGTHG